MSEQTRFQKAVERLQSLAGRRVLVRFLSGTSSTVKGTRGAPSEECQKPREADMPCQVVVTDYGYTEGQNLEEAVELMAARISGTRETVAAADPVAAPAPKASASRRRR